MVDTDRKIRILLTGVGGPAGIQPSRLLAERDGVYVVGCDIDEYSTGRLFVDEFHLCPKVADPEAYEHWLREVIDTHQIDILIPTVHEELPVLGAFAADLPCEVVISNEAALRIGDDKKHMYEWAEEHIPSYMGKWTTLGDWSQDWLEADEQFIKPRQGRGGRGCKRATKEEIAWLKEHTEDGESMIVMEQLPGTEYTVDTYIAKDGTIIYTMVRERMGLAGGISIKGRTVKNQKVIDATKALFGELSCRGPVFVQWKEDVDGNPKLVEMNPRLSGGLMISIAAGVNPIDNILREHRGETLAPQDWKEVTVLGYLDYKVLS